MSTLLSALACGSCLTAFLAIVSLERGLVFWFRSALFVTP